ncbi:DNA-binding protein [Nocardia panacis]|uniref:DNA-binding protein n=1 Tax=Nocardia panacis TaxID=2340916 RepID=A0A3A4KBX7_9NOCA|nr:helix-turn-helix domain-containing protein [Nocardia panacis]RJO77608.1 DNA-binding protein [Nocardia panacis]
MGNTDNTWLTTKEVALRLKVEVRTVDHWAYTGYGPDFIKPGRIRRYALADIIAWENRLREEAKRRRRIAQANIRRYIA